MTTPAPAPPSEPTATSSLATKQPSTLAAWVNVVMIPLAILEVILVTTHTSSAIRTWLAVLLLLAGPGSGLVQFLRIEEPAMQLGLVVAISTAVDLILGQSLLWAHHIDGTLAVCILAGITCIRPVGRSTRTIGGEA